jgi:hypothetical protein
MQTGLPGAWLIKDGRVYKGEHEGRVPTVDLSLPTVSNWHEFEKGSRESDRWGMHETAALIMSVAAAFLVG